jgi:hypothetical protein
MDDGKVSFYHGDTEARRRQESFEFKVSSLSCGT